jgi:hypothetical protein
MRKKCHPREKLILSLSKASINDDQPLVRPEDAFVVTQILDAIYRSHKTGREIF